MRCPQPVRLSDEVVGPQYLNANAPKLLPRLQCILFGLKGKPIVFFNATLDVSRDSLGYDRVAFKANADGAPINLQLHERIKSSASLPLTTAVVVSASESALKIEGEAGRGKPAACTYISQRVRRAARVSRTMA